VNFDFGEVLSRAVQITWKHKILWLFSALPTLLSFLVFPFLFVPMFLMGFDPFSNSRAFESPLFIALIIGVEFFFGLVSLILYIAGTSSVLFGVVSLEGGAERLHLMELFNGGKNYWLRILGVTLLVGLGISVFFLVIFGCMALAGAVTMGLGFICLQPLFILMYPVMLVLYGFIEEAHAAIVVDNLGVIDSIKRGWELVRGNFWRILLISLIVHFGIAVLSGFVMMPLMMPFFFIPILMDSRNFHFTPQNMMLAMGAFSLLFIPVMALVQGITITFMKATFTLVYMRLTKPQDNAPVTLEANA